MREINQFNKIILQKFSSRQAYTFIKGQYVPIIMNNVTDESIMDLDKRKYYVQNYEFQMLGYLIDEEEFEVKPAVARVLQMFEVETSTYGKKRESYPPNPDTFEMNFFYTSGNTVLSEIMDSTVNMNFISSDNVDSYDVYINNDYFGTNVEKILINTNDILRIEIEKNNSSLQANILFENTLV